MRRGEGVREREKRKENRADEIRYFINLKRFNIFVSVLSYCWIRHRSLSTEHPIPQSLRHCNNDKDDDDDDDDNNSARYMRIWEK